MNKGWLSILLLVVSGNSMAAGLISDPEGYEFHGYYGLGYEHNDVDLPTLKSGTIQGLTVIAGNHYRRWLDLELRLSTALDTPKFNADHVSAIDTKITYDYRVTGLLKFKWTPVQALDLNLSTGYSYMDYRLSSPVSEKHGYRGGLVIGGGVGINFSKHYSLNLDYLSYQRDNGMSSSNEIWQSGTLSVQYHY
ncbi:MAG: outer membrane beta-barrel protein [Hydrogenovibrio crunogenus]|nr:outer membrane beta-barrel protein [Hydrogenovibrio crunogenus]